MGRSAVSQALPVHQEDEDLFETSSSFSCDSDEEAQFSDGEDQFVPPAAQPVRRLNSDSVYDLSSMKAQLSVKKGLSQYYDGKSQSFACMSEVRCLEDLPKKSPYKKIKPCRSNIDLVDGNQKTCPLPAPNNMPGGIAKQSSASSCANLMMARTSSANMLYRPPAIPVNKSACHQ